MVFNFFKKKAPPEVSDAGPPKPGSPQKPAPLPGNPPALPPSAPPPTKPNTPGTPPVPSKPPGTAPTPAVPPSHPPTELPPPKAPAKGGSGRNAAAKSSGRNKPVSGRQAAASNPSEPQPEKRGFFKKLTRAISKTRMIFSRKVLGLVGLGKKIDEETLTKLEESMLEADFGVETSEYLMDLIRGAWKSTKIETTDQILPYIKDELKRRLTHRGNTVNFAPVKPTIILVVGVNGVGKTTSVAKLARFFERDGKHVVLAAADTFRAAAVQQLTTWSERIGCEIVTGKDREDPAAVAYRAAERAVEVGADVLLVDTAGRLHTQKNLMDELTKITRAIGKKVGGGPHETVLVLDATTGQNALNQATTFKAAANVTGLFLAKLDGTAKGGAVLTINEKVEVPVKFVGLGESFDDIQGFDAGNFVDALFAVDEDKETGS